MHGVFGRYADVDLTTHRISTFAVPERWQQALVGGRGIAARILLEFLRPGADALGPENVLVFATGPLQGLNVAGAGRHLVAGKSPKTQTVNESYAGGRFGHELGQSGFDGIIVRGRSEEPIYLLVNAGDVSLHPADELWGLAPHAVQVQVEAAHGRGYSVATIGQAGENRVLAACIVHDCAHFAGRPGFGAVMGAKRLKAVVVKGGLRKAPADSELLSVLSSRFTKEVASLRTSQGLKRLGTAGALEAFNDGGMLPSHNFRETYFADAAKIGGARLAEEILVGRKTCPGCPIVCKRVVKGAWDGRFFDDTYGGPEYETLAALGSLCGNSDLHSIAYMNHLCNQYGLDTISVGIQLAYLMEATDRGLLASDGAMQWGDVHAMVACIERFARREGVGEYAAQGIEKLAEHVGDSSFAMHSKGQELPMHTPRAKLSMALYYATSPRGGTHLEGTVRDAEPPTPELGLDGPNERLTWENRSAIASTWQNVRSFANSLVLCTYNSYTARGEDEVYVFPTIREITSAVTGIALDAEKMLAIGARNFALLRVAAERDGYTRKDDLLPSRFKEPIPSGPGEGLSVPEERLQDLIDDYYRVNGFGQYGPSTDRIKELGLDDILS